MGFKLMSDQQRVRISLSETAFLVTREDMLQFHVASRSSFMNTVFRNFHEEAEASGSSGSPATFQNRRLTGSKRILPTGMYSSWPAVMSRSWYGC